MDLVIDTVGGPDSSRFLTVLKRGGTVLPVFSAQYDPEETASLGITSNGPQLAEIGRPFDGGKLQAEVASTYPLPQAGNAHTRAAQRHLQGKIVLTVFS